MTMKKNKQCSVITEKDSLVVHYIGKNPHTLQSENIMSVMIFTSL